ncbi:MAG: NAD-dependent epimerase/dehydratase family protein, partial [Rhodothermales bacterium]|nr:NAD-dependent epimerase/dehydratase family protein [Rhodothermales bacterium]
AWLQGARYSLMLDSLINDFVTGEIEHAVHAAWSFSSPDVIVIEGQGSLLNPAYPGGFEIIAAARPDAVVLQHAPARKDYDGFPGHPVHPLAHQIEAVQMITGKDNVAALTINHENIPSEEIDSTCRLIEMLTGLPTVDPLTHDMDPILDALRPYIEQ